MANALKFVRCASAINSGLNDLRPNLNLAKIRPTATTGYRQISTSKKSKIKNDEAPITIVDSLSEIKRGDSIKNTKSELPQTGNWISWGFHSEDIIMDNTFMHIAFFLTITMTFVGGGFILMYMPDNRMCNWVKREAYLELRRREELGLPLVDKDLIPLDKIELPTDEELGDAEITI